MQGMTVGVTAYKMYVYIYMCVWRESKFIYLQTAIVKKQIPSHTFANLSHTPANPTFIFRGVASIHFCAVETHSNSMQTATVSAIRETAKGRCKVVLGKFHQGIAEVHCLPHSLDLPLQRCCVGYWLPWTLSLSPLLSRNFCETFAKNPLQINRKIHTLNRGWGFSQLHLITIYIVLGLFSTCQNNS